MRIFTLLPAFLALSFYALAQNSPVLCGHELVLKNWENNFPEVRQTVQDVFANAQASTAQANTRSNEVYTIPVVVHIVWRDSIENIPDSLITNQLRVLNEDYRRLNPDTSNLRSIFKPYVGDPRIEFELVEIVRVQTDALFELTLAGALPDNVKQSAAGGSDAWDTENYLNIWVCEIQPITVGGLNLGEILGYAYPPAGLSNWPEGVSAPSPELDGVVIDFRAFGVNNPYPIDLPGIDSTIVIQGRTAVHEVGHFLGLRHIWGDGGGIFGGDSCGEDDGVLDTPNTAGQANFDCDDTRNTCTDANNDLPDMIENYMDYARESCMNSFTLGQINIMRYVLENERCGLVDNCLQTSTKDINALSDQLEVFPNPTNDLIAIHIKGVNLKDAHFIIHDVLGKTVLEGEQINTQISLRDLSPGIYFLRLRSGHQEWTKRIVVE